MKNFTLAMIGAAILLLPSAGLPQEKKGAFIDGEYVEDYVYVPDFMQPDDLKKAIESHSTDIVIVDTAATPVWEDEHIKGAVSFPYAKDIKPPVALPRDKTLVVYCACKDHEDSTDVARQLSLLGYRKVKVLKGGWFKWQDLKYPTEGASAK
jgi:rhodanese-related sulfurtransferase